MSEDKITQDESEYVQQFLDALFKRDKEKNKNLQGLDRIVGYERRQEPKLVIECIKAPNRSIMIWYCGGYCLCSRFYKCKYQSKDYTVIDGKERAACEKYTRIKDIKGELGCDTGESV